MAGRIFEKIDAADQVFDFRLWTHYWTLRAVRGLCVRIKDLPRAMRPKLVVIWTSRDLFRGIFARETL